MTANQQELIFSSPLYQAVFPVSQNLSHSYNACACPGDLTQFHHFLATVGTGVWNPYWRGNSTVRQGQSDPTVLPHPLLGGTALLEPLLPRWLFCTVLLHVGLSSLGWYLIPGLSVHGVAVTRNWAWHGKNVLNQSNVFSQLLRLRNTVWTSEFAMVLMLRRGWKSHKGPCASWKGRAIKKNSFL